MSYLLTVPRAAKGPGPGLAGLLRGLGPVPQWRGRGLGQDDSGGDFADVISQSDVNASLAAPPSFAGTYGDTMPATLDISALNPDAGIFSSSELIPSAGVGTAPSTNSSSFLSVLSSLAGTGAAIANAATQTSPPSGSGLTQAQWNAMTAAQQQAYLNSLSSTSQLGTYLTTSTIWPPLPNWAVYGGGAIVAIVGIALFRKIVK
jgi:hypothetical protein